MDKPILIAEIGCNHMGDLEIAYDMIAIAADCGANIVKFQKRNPKECLTKEEYNAPHPRIENSYGDTYGAHREFLEFDAKEHKKLKAYTEKCGIEYSVSVWDFTSVDLIVNIVQPKHIKIPSALATNFKILNYVLKNFKGTIHISTGMTTVNERETLLNYIDTKDLNSNKLVIYHCTSGYPIPFNQATLLELNTINSMKKGKHFELGFSGHHKGIAIDIAAYTLGAQYIERHFTLDRTWKGTDHAASLEPSGLRKLVRDLKATHEALKYKPSGFLPIERTQAKKLRWDRKELFSSDTK